MRVSPSPGTNQNFDTAGVHFPGAGFWRINRGNAPQVRGILRKDDRQLHRTGEPVPFGGSPANIRQSHLIDGFFSQLPFKCYLPEVESVGDCLKICLWVASRVVRVKTEVTFEQIVVRYQTVSWCGARPVKSTPTHTPCVVQSTASRAGSRSQVVLFFPSIISFFYGAATRDPSRFAKQYIFRQQLRYQTRQ